MNNQTHKPTLIIITVLILAVIGGYFLEEWHSRTVLAAEIKRELTENESLAMAINDTWGAHAREIRNINRDARFGGGDVRQVLDKELYHRRFPLLLPGDGPKRKEILLETKHFKIPLLFIMTTTPKNIERGAAYACAALVMPKNLPLPKGIPQYFLIPDEPETRTALGVDLETNWPSTSLRNSPYIQIDTKKADTKNN